MRGCHSVIIQSGYGVTQAHYSLITVQIQFKVYKTDLTVQGLNIMVGMFEFAVVEWNY